MVRLGNRLGLIVIQIKSSDIHSSRCWHKLLQEHRENAPLFGFGTNTAPIIVFAPFVTVCTNETLYDGLPKISNTITTRRLRLPGHCLRSNEPATMTLFWNPTHRKKHQGRPMMTYTSQLAKETGLSTEEMPTAMHNRDQWRELARGSGAAGRDR